MITRYLGIDYGTVRIGLALGDSETKLAIPFTVVADLAAIIEVIKAEEIDELVVGAPLTMRSEKGEMLNKVEDFIKRLKTKTNLPINIFDERLSSKAGDALSGGKRAKADRDALAAMVILQSFIDKNVI